MLARIQQAITIAILAAALGWAIAGAIAGQPFSALAGAALIVTAYALFLAAEFCALWLCEADGATPRATIGQLARAWSAEVIAAPLTFCWRQPFRSARWPDHLPSGTSGRRGVLLIHGFFCNRGFWNDWLARLTEADVPAIAVTLEPIFGSIDSYAVAIETAVNELERRTSTAPIVVAHSMGGLALRRWYRDEPRAERIASIITIGTPHHGTLMARLAFSENGRQMRMDSKWLRELRELEPSSRYGRFTCFFSNCDNIVFPPSAATLPGAQNRHLEASPHVHLAAHPAIWAELRLQLSQQ